jgi:hypothetical protein
LVYLDSNKELFTLLNISSFDKIQGAINNIAPSLLEYHLEQLIQNIQSNIILNRHNIQDTINLDIYTIYIDYSDNLYIEVQIIEDDYITESLW